MWLLLGGLAVPLEGDELLDAFVADCAASTAALQLPGGLIPCFIANVLPYRTAYLRLLKQRTGVFVNT
ncbi:MAG: hypothetical protein ACUVX8_04075 [Candidatus Zipacnadales bacterium]